MFLTERRHHKKGVGWNHRGRNKGKELQLLGDLLVRGM